MRTAVFSKKFLEIFCPRQIEKTQKKNPPSLEGVFLGVFLPSIFLGFAALAAAPNCSTPKPVASFRCDQPGIVDGDTLRCASGERVRLWGVNAVERGEAGYAEAGRALQAITREPIECCEFYRDRYRRPVAQCFNRKGDIAAQMIAVGRVADMARYSRGYYGAACWGGWR